MLARKGSLFVTRPTLFDYYVTPEESHAGIARLFAMLDSGAVTPEIGQTYRLEDAAEVHRALEAGGDRRSERCCCPTFPPAERGAAAGFRTAAVEILWQLMMGLPRRTAGIGNSLRFGRARVAVLCSTLSMPLALTRAIRASIAAHSAAVRHVPAALRRSIRSPQPNDRFSFLFFGAGATARRACAATGMKNHCRRHKLHQIKTHVLPSRTRNPPRVTTLMGIAKRKTSAWLSRVVSTAFPFGDPKH